MIQGNSKATQLDVQIDQLTARISAHKLPFHEVDVTDLKIVGPQVVVTEGDLRSEPSASEENSSPPLWTYLIEATELTQGTFTYIRQHQNKNAPIHVSGIQGAMDAIGDAISGIKDYRTEITHAKVTGQLEKSGNFVLNIATPLYTEPLHVDIDLRITDQNLSDLNPYFQTDDGITLTGSLRSGRSVTLIQARKLKASVQANYSELNVQFKKTDERSAIETVLSNVVKSIKLNSSSAGKKPIEQTADVELPREPQEALMHFIFRGMRDAALKVAASSSHK